MIPTKSPGTLFESLTGNDPTLNIRWLQATDPVYFEVFNRPLSDLTVRQLVIAKALDNVQLKLGHQALFPFLVQPLVSSGTDVVDVPLGWIWDMHASMPKKWERLRLAKIKRISGVNDVTSGYTGKLRLIFTASVGASTTEVAVFYVDYEIDSDLTYQCLKLQVVPSTEEPIVINPGEEETVCGLIIFKTMSLAESGVISFLDLLAPPAGGTDANSDGYYDNPTVYDIVDTVPGGSSVTDDFSSNSLNHGTGLLTNSAWNAIPQLDSDIQAWLVSLNYPFASGASRTSSDSIQIPAGLFKEFNITAPVSDQPTGDISGTYSPVWINRIEQVNINLLRFYFSTYNITADSPSVEGIEFATLDLLRSYGENQRVAIVPIDNLLLQPTSDDSFQQQFGKGHVVLSSLWDGITTEVEDFFDAFSFLVDNPIDTIFPQANTLLSSFGISRVPRYTPTAGQAEALVGSTARRTTPIHPSDTNRYVCEQDQGIGSQVDLDNQPGIVTNSAIDRYGYRGGLNHRIVKLVIDATQLGSDPSFYDNQVLPRLRYLFGRDPQFGDFWHNGTRLMFYNGDTWQG
jgi:hypothetical protein